MAQAEYALPRSADASHLAMQPTEIGVGMSTDSVDRLALERSLEEQKLRVEELQKAIAEAAVAEAAQEATQAVEADRKPVRQLSSTADDGSPSAANVVAPPRLAPITDTAPAPTALRLRSRAGASSTSQ